MHKSNVAIVLLSAISAVTASAKVCVWNGGGALHNGELYWTDAGNWEDGNVPDNGDTVSFFARSDAPHRINMNLQLENLFYTNTFGAKFNGKDDRVLTLTGDKSEIVIGEEEVNFLTPLCLPENAKLKICNAGIFEFKNPCQISGAGEITKTGNGRIYFYRSSNNFSGIWHFRNGEIMVASDVDNPFGSEQARVHVYGKNESAGTSSEMRIRCLSSFANSFYFHDSYPRTYSTATFNGDVYFYAEQEKSFHYLQCYYAKEYYRSATPPGFIINGTLTAGTSPYESIVQVQSYSLTDGFVEINGTLNLGGRTLEFKCNSDNDSGTLRINAPVVSTATTSLTAYGNGVKFICGADEVLGGRNKDVAFGGKNKNSSIVLDLCGYDQTICRLLFTQTQGYSTAGSITSTKGPATLFVTRVYNGADNHNILSLDGEVTLSLEKGNATMFPGFVFAGGSTTGWIISDYPACDLTKAAFPNLGGIALSKSGIAQVSALTALKNGVKLDFNSLSTGYLRVDTGVSIKAGQVIYNNVDVPAGIYCRAGAGIEGALEVPWLGGDGNDFNGTVEVVQHAPTLVWTGNGESSSVSDASNWGANAVPDFSDETLTLDFRRATAETPISISGTVAPACSFTSGDVNQGAPHFTGTGTLVLGGDGVLTNRFVFTDKASLTYNGDGTLVLKDAISTTTGTLTVASGGKVVLDASAWHGNVVVEAGGVLEVLSSCGSSVFAPVAGENRCVIKLDGKLALGKGVSAEVKSLRIGRGPVLRDRTYGSASSGAAVQDDLHFAGEGTIVSRQVPGLIVILQ